MSRPDIILESAGAYEPTLEAEGKVIPSFGKRRDKIVAELSGGRGAAPRSSCPTSSSTK